MVTRFNKTRKRNAGFTLIEMLVAVLIMGILLAVAIPLYLSSVKNAYDNTAKNNDKTLATAAAAFRVNNGTFPASMTALTATKDVVDPSDTTGGANSVVYTVVGTTSDVTITATAPANTFSSGTKWIYTASTGLFTNS